MGSEMCIRDSSDCFSLCLFPTLTFLPESNDAKCSLVGFFLSLSPLTFGLRLFLFQWLERRMILRFIWMQTFIRSNINFSAWEKSHNKLHRLKPQIVPNDQINEIFRCRMALFFLSLQYTHTQTGLGSFVVFPSFFLLLILPLNNNCRSIFG